MILENFILWKSNIKILGIKNKKNCGIISILYKKNVNNKDSNFQKTLSSGIYHFTLFKKTLVKKN